jgi:hypothetical protein
MHSALVALILAIWSNLHAHGPDAARIAEAIAGAVESEASPASGESIAVDAALLALYAAKESHLSEHPMAESWDAKAGLSCGYLQLRCALTRDRSLRQQAQTWLAAVRRGGLVAADSSRSRAARRMEEARAALGAAMAGAAP